MKWAPYAANAILPFSSRKTSTEAGFPDLVRMTVLLGHIPDFTPTPARSPKEYSDIYTRALGAFSQGRFAAAADMFEQAFQVSLRAELAAPLTLKYKALCFQYRGQYDQARALFLRAAYFDYDLSNKIDSLNNLGWLAYLDGDLNLSLKYLSEAEAKLRVQYPKGYSAHMLLPQATLVNLGVVLQARGEYGKALKYYLQALPLLVNPGDDMTKTRAYQHLGLLELAWGDRNAALAHFERALRTGEEADGRSFNKAYYIDTLIDFADMLRKTGDRLQTRRLPERGRDGVPHVDFQPSRRRRRYVGVAAQRIPAVQASLWAPGPRGRNSNQALHCPRRHSSRAAL
jgi:tetratricopeptide (TPR) repeat protein